MIWQTVIALSHSNGQLRTDRDGETEKGCRKPVVQQKTTDDDPSTTYVTTVGLSFYVWAVALKPKYIRKHVGMTAASGSAATAVTSL